MAGLLTLAYVVVVAFDVLARAWGRELLVTWRDLAGSLPLRLVMAALVVAALHHTLDGVARIVTEGSDDRGPTARSAVAFASWALGIPAAAAVVWPALPWGAG